MSLFVLDTDILSLYAGGVEPARSRIDPHDPAELAITVITVEEQMSGWYDYIRRHAGPARQARGYANLASTVRFLGRWHILPYAEADIARFNALLGLKLNVRRNDLRIAAIALAAGATLVTRNARDFSRVPGLIHENWAA